MFKAVCRFSELLFYEQLKSKQMAEEFWMDLLYFLAIPVKLDFQF